jgi:hypothetical protein
MLKYLLLIPLLILTTLTFAQKEKRHSFSLLASGIQSLNNNETDVRQSTERFVGAPLPKYLSVKNSLGYQLEFQYEYRSKTNYLLSLGLQTGVQNREHEYDFQFLHYRDGYDFTSFRNQYVERETARYVGLSAMVGYNYVPFKKNKLAIQFKTGLTYLRFFNEDLESKMHNIIYQIKDTLFQSPFAFTEVLERSTAMYYQFYLGLSSPSGLRFIKEYKAGIGFTHAWGGFKRNNDYVAGAHSIFYNSNGEIMSSAVYFNRYRNIVFTVGVGF